VFPNPDWVDLAVRRWHTIADGLDPAHDTDLPGMPPVAQLRAEVAALLAPPAS
jgi:hypothetical protein